MDTTLFYTHLHSHTQPLHILLSDKANFFALPDDWDIVITDIKGSTQAVDAGLYREVNLAAASSIISALNTLKQHNITIPFVFGGDGATLCVPHMYLKEVLAHMRSVAYQTKKSIGIELRVGAVSMKKIAQLGHEVLIAKHHITEGYDQAIFLGEGLTIAETYIKKDIHELRVPKKDAMSPNLTGLECRWKEIQPPKEAQDILCLIVLPQKKETAHHTFATILKYIDDMYGTHHERHPVREEHLKLIKSFLELRKEAMMKCTSHIPIRTFQILLENFYALILFKFQKATQTFDPIKYKKQLVAATDVLKIDGGIKTILSGSEDAHNKLMKILDDLETRGEIIHGTYRTDGTVMTCYVYNRNAGHIHFLDGKNGGYTQAAKMFKEKLKKKV